MLPTAMILAVVATVTWLGADLAEVRLRAMTGPGRERRTPRWAGTLARWVRRRHDGRRADAWRAACVELCHGVVAELVAGRPPGEALARAAEALAAPYPDVLRPVILAARDGRDVVAPLLRVAADQGGDGPARLAACWHVGVSVGGGLAAMVEQVGLSLREQEEHRAEVRAQLAGPRSTARLLAVLPLLGLALGAALGLRPLSFLFGGPAGLGCLLAGVALDLAGLWWIGRLVARAGPAMTGVRPAGGAP
ncbi:hypothetical protein Sru01_62050 [Sphaerisporangium rufum]|uniref:Type II secretion system protein GspF domain-containing protein n=1 Tax=Sphaerisporangium rufum TaxID=1381558 RepID=A0A919V4I3_9ACTN|nr:type II secretion system F family protein [Sphaerisporangium rufum]GII81223.1 hypothetical protein Sru01_62050 [Sphaerisporangium rufum]